MFSLEYSVYLSSFLKISWVCFIERFGESVSYNELWQLFTQNLPSKNVLLLLLTHRVWNEIFSKTSHTLKLWVYQRFFSYGFQFARTSTTKIREIDFMVVAKYFFFPIKLFYSEQGLWSHRCNLHFLCSFHQLSPQGNWGSLIRTFACIVI